MLADKAKFGEYEDELPNKFDQVASAGSLFCRIHHHHYPLCERLDTNRDSLGTYGSSVLIQILQGVPYLNKQEH